MEVGEEGVLYNIYLSLHCHHQNDSCIKIGSDENHFNVKMKHKFSIAERAQRAYINCEEQSHKTVSADHNF